MPIHTPGPWFLEPLDLIIYDGALPSSQAVAVAECRSNVGEQESNARLIAAAPDLLDALKDVNECLTNLYDDEPRIAGEFFGAALQERMEDAIAIAEHEPRRSLRTVVVEVSGGVAEVVQCSDDVEVQIIDRDSA